MYNRKISTGVLLLLCVIIAVGAYFWGKKNGTVTIDSFTNNSVFIKEIAELSSLEAQGTTSIKSTNIANDGSFTDELKKMFLEKTVQITIPYVAKYGINIAQQSIVIEEKGKQVRIVLPTPQLLSYELRMDKADAITKKGWFESADDVHYSAVEKKLYTQSRMQLEKNPVYIQQSKDKIRKIIAAYYAPLQMEVQVSFADDVKKAIDKPLY